MRKLKYLLFPALLLFPVLAMADVIDNGTFLQMVFDAVKNFGGLAWAGKITLICTLLVALTKVSFLQAVWAKLGAAQVLVSSLLGAIIGVVSLSMSGSLSAAGVVAYMLSGAGAVFLHQLLDAIKGIPGLGTSYVAMINFFESLLGGGSQS